MHEVPILMLTNNYEVKHRIRIPWLGPLSARNLIPAPTHGAETRI